MKTMKKMIIILLLILFPFQVFAAPQTFDRNTLENNGVNKKWEITDSNKDHVMNTYAVDANEKVYDFAEVLTEEEENKLRERIGTFIERTNMDMVILIVNYPYPENMSNYCYNENTADKQIASFNEDYAADFYDYNDFGLQFEKYDGVLLIRNTAIDPCFNAMFYDMYTFGNAQLYFSQYRYDSILDGIYNNLHSGNYVSGFNDFINKTEYYIASGKESEFDNYYVDDYGYLQQYPKKYKAPLEVCACISGVITLIIMIILIKKNKMVKKAHQADSYINRRTLDISNRKDVFIASHTTHYTISHDSGGGGGGGGHSSHSGSSGGGHSSGGGRHG